MTPWTPIQLPDLHGTRVIITGASSGIGLEAAKHLAKAGAQVIAAVRNLDKARQVLPSEVDIRHLDLADLESVHQFASGIDQVDLLINNAGIMAVPLTRTRQGFESQFGTNHLGHFALTGLLMNRIGRRVVNVSSTAHRMGRMNFDDLNWHKSYRRWAAYGQSKLANLLFTRELQARLTKAGSPVLALAAHPGYANTALQGHTESALQDGFMRVIGSRMAQSADAGSWPMLYAAVADIPGNSFVGPDGFGQTRGYPTLVPRSKAAQSDADAARLWQASEQLTSVSFPI